MGRSAVEQPKDDDTLVLSELMLTKQLYKKTAKHWVNRLQAKGDPPPQFLACGAGSSFATCDNVRKALKRHPNARPVRGYRILFLHLHDHDWVVKAVFHMVVEHPAQNGEKHARYECVTKPYNLDEIGRGFCFVPSSRVHCDLTNDEILSGRWWLGVVFLGCDVFCNAVIARMKTQGRVMSTVGRSPEECAARPIVKIVIPPAIRRWISDRFPDEDLVSLAEMFGMPSVGRFTETAHDSLVGEIRILFREVRATCVQDHVRRRMLESMLSSLFKEHEDHPERVLKGSSIFAYILMAEYAAQTGDITKEEAERRIFEMLDEKHIEFNKIKDAQLKDYLRITRSHSDELEI